LNCPDVSDKDKKVLQRFLQNRIIDSAQLVMAKSARLVLEAQRSMSTPANRAQQESLAAAGKEVSRALGGTMSCLPGQAEVEQSIVQIDTLSR